MNKDAILATIIGFGVGLVIAALVFIGPSMVKGLPHFSLPNLSALTAMFSMKSKTGSNAKATTTPKLSDTLSIESPLPDAIEPKNETLISGTTIPNATVVIEGEDTENVVVANANGAYAGKLELSEGKNDIVVTSYAKNNVQSEDVTVYYTPESF